VGASKLSANLADGSAALPENMSVGIGDGVERLHEELDSNFAHSPSTLASTERAREMPTVEVPLTRHRDRRHTKCRIAH
jgi:hypothetical protein